MFGQVIEVSIRVQLTRVGGLAGFKLWRKPSITA
jgi:hypothetical protein